MQISLKKCGFLAFLFEFASFLLNTSFSVLLISRNQFCEVFMKSLALSVFYVSGKGLAWLLKFVSDNLTHKNRQGIGKPGIERYT